MTPERQAELAWNLLTELRRELVESQRLRTQIIVAKVTFVSATFALIAANLDKVDIALLAIPAFAAIFFDFLVNSYSFSVNRIGWYNRSYLEPLLRKGYGIPQHVLLWQEFLLLPEARQILALFGNLGLTLVSVAAGVVALLRPVRPFLSISLIVVLVVFVALDIWSTFYARQQKFMSLSDDRTMTAHNPADQASS